MGIRDNFIKAFQAYQGKPVNVDEKALYEMSFNRDYKLLYVYMLTTTKQPKK
jgi:hypothetical protein